MTFFEIARVQKESLFSAITQAEKENNEDLKHIYAYKVNFTIILSVARGLCKIILIKSFVINWWQI